MRAEAGNDGELSSHAVVGRLQVAAEGMMTDEDSLPGAAMAGSGKCTEAGTAGTLTFLDAERASNEGEPGLTAMPEPQRSGAIEHLAGNEVTSDMRRTGENPASVTGVGRSFGCVASIVSLRHPSAALLTTKSSLDPAAG